MCIYIFPQFYLVSIQNKSNFVSHIKNNHIDNFDHLSNSSVNISYAYFKNGTIKQNYFFR